MKQNTSTSSVRFHVYDVALAAIRELAGPVQRVREKDGPLANQMRRAAHSITLNLREGNRRGGKDRRYQFRVAAGSADEVCAALDVALAWGYLAPGEARPSLELLDRVLAMLWRLTH